jgi:beta-glucosidase
LDVPNEPLYAFGEGLSYTTFEYGDISLSAEEFGPKGELVASITVTNTGKRDGIETVQMYIRDLVGSVTRPVKQLKGFERVNLQAGESKTVSFTITPETLSFWRKDMSFRPESGKFDIFIGHASNDVKSAKFAYNE